MGRWTELVEVDSLVLEVVWLLDLNIFEEIRHLDHRHLFLNLPLELRLTVVV